jgi:hypothetical protein
MCPIFRIFRHESHSSSEVYAVGFDLNARVFLSGLGRRDQWWDFFPVTEPLELPDNEFNGNWFKIHLLPQYFEDRHFDSESPYAWGFPFHVSCWEHLSRVFPVRKKASKSASRFEDDSTSDSILQLLFSLCRVFPISRGAVAWGHNYRLDFRSPQRQQQQQQALPVPGDEYEDEIEERIQRNRELSDAELSNPFDVQQIRRILDEVLATTPASHIDPSLRHQASTQDLAKDARDIFEFLPVEIRSAIFTELPNEDVVNLKIASPAFRNVVLTNAFWK